MGFDEHQVPHKLMLRHLNSSPKPNMIDETEENVKCPANVWRNAQETYFHELGDKKLKSRAQHQLKSVRLKLSVNDHGQDFSTSYSTESLVQFVIVLLILNFGYLVRIVYALTLSFYHNEY